MFPVERHGDSVLLRLDDGKVNAMGPAFVDVFSKAWAEATQEGRAVVLAGNAKAFSAGLDLKTLPTLSPDELRAFARGFLRMFAEVAAYERPVVAAVDGPALAGGAILALSADFRLVGPRARIGLTEVPVGVPFPAPIAHLAQARLPPAEHAYALLRGLTRDGEAAVGSGWAHAFHPTAELEPRALALADELAQLPRTAFASAKRALNGPLAESLARFARDEADAWADLVASPTTIEEILEGFQRMTRK